MMKSLHDRKLGKKRGRIILSILACIILACMLSYFFMPSLQRSSQAVFRPFWRAGSALSQGFRDIGSFFASRKNLTRENDLLKQELAEARSRVLDRDVLYQENLSLKETFARKPAGNFTLATILTKPNTSLYDTFILDIGTDGGIKVGDKVFADGSILLGEITEAGAHTSTAKLFSTPGNMFFARVSGLDIDAEVTGRGGGNFEMTLPRDAVVAEGTAITLPDLMPHIVALAGKSISDQRDPFQKILLISPVNINELNWVEILTN